MNRKMDWVPSSWLEEPSVAHNNIVRLKVGIVIREHVIMYGSMDVLQMVDYTLEWIILSKHSDKLINESLDFNNSY